MSKLSDEELRQWAEKRADDAGRLARELLAARADVRRLEWIEAQYFPAVVAQVGADKYRDVAHLISKCGPGGPWQIRWYGGMGDWDNISGEGGTLRGAIDAAMQAERGEGEG